MLDQTFFRALARICLHSFGLAFQSPNHPLQRQDYLGVRSGPMERLVIDRSGFNSQRRQSFPIWLWRAIYPSQVLAERD